MAKLSEAQREALIFFLDMESVGHSGRRHPTTPTVVNLWNRGLMQDSGDGFELSPIGRNCARMMVGEIGRR